MKSVRGFAVGLAALAMIVLMTPSGAFANVASTPATVGDFLAAYATALKIELPAGAGADALVGSLAASGVKLDAKIDPAKTLTQGDVVRIGKANALRVSTKSPDALFTAEEVSQFFSSYGLTLARSSGVAALSEVDPRSATSATADEGGNGSNPPGDPAGHANTDKGKKKGRPFQSPTEPE